MLLYGAEALMLSKADEATLEGSVWANSIKLVAYALTRTVIWRTNDTRLRKVLKL